MKKLPEQLTRAAKAGKDGSFSSTPSWRCSSLNPNNVPMSGYSRDRWKVTWRWQEGKFIVLTSPVLPSLAVTSMLRLICSSLTSFYCLCFQLCYTQQGIFPCIFALIIHHPYNDGSWIGTFEEIGLSDKVAKILFVYRRLKPALRKGKNCEKFLERTPSPIMHTEPFSQRSILTCYCTASQYVQETKKKKRTKKPRESC